MRPLLGVRQSQGSFITPVAERYRSYGHAYSAQIQWGVHALWTRGSGHIAASTPSHPDAHCPTMFPSELWVAPTVLLRLAEHGRRVDGGRAVGWLVGPTSLPVRRPHPP